MKRIIFTLYLLIVSILIGFSQQALLTKAEKSDFNSTSDYSDVMSFVNNLKKSSPYIRYEKIASTVEGRDVPLLIMGDPLPGSAESLKTDKRVVIYIQANIHAGEVEGKEASLMFMRDLLSGKDRRLLKNVVLLVCPLFNADGNEKISPQNRTYQNGPVNGVGVRYNGQMLDLNRDAMKAESPEVRGVLANVFDKWDPAIFMDCHTTDGSFHVEPTTFTWMVNPNGDNSLIAYMRDKLMPAVSNTLRDKYKVENCFYGEFIDMLAPEKGWILDASEPRYMSNYYGLRNRLGILNENYVYADFKSRVLGCYSLIKSLVEYASVNKDEIKSKIAEADRRNITRGTDADSFAIEYKVRPLPQNVTVRTYEAEPGGETDGWKNFKRTDRQKDVSVPYLIDFYPVKKVKIPYAYILMYRDPSVISLLKLHGLTVEELSSDMKLTTGQFRISELKASQRLNQGHYTNNVKGSYTDAETQFPAGALVIRTNQRLGNLAAYLLEPQSNDGLLYWNYLDKYLVPQWGSGFNVCPVYKLNEKTDLPLKPVR